MEVLTILGSPPESSALWIGVWFSPGPISVVHRTWVVSGILTED